MFPTSSSTNTDLRAGVFTPPATGVHALSRPEGTRADQVATNGAGSLFFAFSLFFAKNVSAASAGGTREACARGARTVSARDTSRGIGTISETVVPKRTLPIGRDGVISTDDKARASEAAKAPARIPTSFRLWRPDYQLPLSDSQPLDGLAPTAQAFEALMQGFGVDAPTDVVLLSRQYDETRLWWLLTAFGKASVWLVDGGYDAYVAAGLPTTLTPPIATIVSPTRRPQDCAGEAEPSGSGSRWTMVVVLSTIRSMNMRPLIFFSDMTSSFAMSLANPRRARTGVKA